MKKLLKILVLIMLIITIFQIANMYALYKDELQGEYTNLLGIWSIKVNESDISSGGENLTFNMTEDNLTYIDSDRVKSQKLAPGTQAYFEIIIDPANTDVAIVYTLNIKLEEVTTANLKLLKVENYFQKNDETEQTVNEKVYTDNTLNLHEAIIPLDIVNNKYLNHVRLYFEWENLEENNEQDSALGQTENAKINIPLEINLKQYIGEEIGNGQEEGI